MGLLDIPKKNSCRSLLLPDQWSVGVVFLVSIK